MIIANIYIILYIICIIYFIYYIYIYFLQILLRSCVSLTSPPISLREFRWLQSGIFFFIIRKDVARNNSSNIAAAQSTALRALSVSPHLPLMTSLRQGYLLVPFYRGASRLREVTWCARVAQLRRGSAGKRNLERPNFPTCTLIAVECAVPDCFFGTGSQKWNFCIKGLGWLLLWRLPTYVLANTFHWC